MPTDSWGPMDQDPDTMSLLRRLIVRQGPFNPMNGKDSLRDFSSYHNSPLRKLADQVRKEMAIREHGNSASRASEWRDPTNPLSTMRGSLDEMMREDRPDYPPQFYPHDPENLETSHIRRVGPMDELPGEVWINDGDRRLPMSSDTQHPAVEGLWRDAHRPLREFVRGVDYDEFPVGYLKPGDPTGWQMNSYHPKRRPAYPNVPESPGTGAFWDILAKDYPEYARGTGASDLVSTYNRYNTGDRATRGSSTLPMQMGEGLVNTARGFMNDLAGLPRAAKEAYLDPLESGAESLYVNASRLGKYAQPAEGILGSLLTGAMVPDMASDVYSAAKRPKWMLDRLMSPTKWMEEPPWERGEMFSDVGKATENAPGWRAGSSYLPSAGY